MPEFAPLTNQKYFRLLGKTFQISSYYILMVCDDFLFEEDWPI